MQSNFQHIKITRKHTKQETAKHVKTSHKGKTWKRGTDKRNFSFDSLKGV
jgi:hypothetical protein